MSLIHIVTFTMYLFYRKFKDLCLLNIAENKSKFSRKAIGDGEPGQQTAFSKNGEL